MRPSADWSRRAIVTLVGGAVIAVVACGGRRAADTTAEPASTGAAAPASTSAATTASTAAPTAPPSARVDLATPTFSDPTSITNPLFPIAELDQVIQLGEEAGAATRNEVTLLPETKVIEWNGGQVRTVMSQFVAYEDGEVLEIAVDYFAQADDGSVWYFGEDVENYVDGVVDNTVGTWIAGRDGPPGMIMPADPRVGDVYRPENISGLVFEEVTVKAIEQTVDGPTGPVDGAVVTEEVLMDGVREDKTFAPGYGEFSFAVAVDQEAVDMGLAVPTDAAPGAVPTEPSAISTAVDETLAAVAADDVSAVEAALADMRAAWAAYRANVLPPRLEQQLADALDELSAVATTENGLGAETALAAIAVGQAGLDLELQHRPVADVDHDRLELWQRRLELHQAAGDDALAAGDQVIIEAIQRRSR